MTQFSMMLCGKRMFFFFACVASVLITVTPVAHAQDVKMRENDALKYKAGQKWSYQAREGEENSYLIILRIDKDPKLGDIIHITLRGLKIKSRRSPEGIIENVSHMPFSEEALNKSGLKLLKEKTEVPDFKEGYRMWREAYDAGRAGIYSITVAEAVQVMETALNK